MCQLSSFTTHTDPIPKGSSSVEGRRGALDILSALPSLIVANPKLLIKGTATPGNHPV